MPHPSLKPVPLNDEAACLARDPKDKPGEARCRDADDELQIPALSLPPTDRVIHLDDMITRESSVRVRRALHRFEQESDESVVVKINTPGGYMNEMFAIHDMLQTCPLGIYTVIIGNAYSAGSVILQGGDIRVMTRNSALMLHKGSFHMHGTVDLDDLEKIMRDARFEEERGYEILMARTGQPRSVIEKWHKGNTFMTAFEAIENNLADALLVPRSVEEEPLKRDLKFHARRLTSRFTEAFESLHVVADFASRISDMIGTDGDEEEESQNEADHHAVRPRRLMSLIRKKTGKLR